MADYLPLIARAVEALDKNSGENRRALYERARTALVAQLRGVQPALEESEITRERLALEEAIRKIEAESARKAREERPAPPPRRPDPPPRQNSAPRQEDPSHPQPPREAPVAVPPPRTTSRLSLSDEALKGFRDIVGESTTSLDAPRTETRGFTPTQRPTVAIPQPSSPPQAPTPLPPQDLDQLEPRVEQRSRHDNLWALPLESATPAQPAEEYAEPEPHAPAPRAGAARPRAARQAASPEEPIDEQPRIRPSRSYPGLIRIAVALALIACIGAGIWWKRDAVVALFGVVSDVVSSKPGPSPAPTANNPATPAARPKISDRIGQPSSQATGPAVAQRVVLYEEVPDDPQGKQLTGQALWRTEMTSPAPGRAPEMVVKADVTVPERNLSMTWSLRRNSDPSLPASHTIEIMFNLPADSPTGGVQNVPGVLMKQSESARGVPLAGLAVKVTPGFFLIGLSSLETDVQRNLQILKDRPWFDIPVVYNNNRRAILAMEKGTPGEKAFADAFAAWKQ